MPAAEVPDHELIAAYRRGDADQFEVLYQRYRRPLYGYLNRMLPGQAATVDDLFQQTWLKAIDNLERYEDRQTFFSWLARIAHNAAIDHLRREKQQPDVPLDDVDVSEEKEVPWQSLSAAELGRAVEKAVAQLPPDQREVLLLRQQGVPFKEIAALQGAPLNTVLGRMHYAVNRLREILRDWQ